MIGGAVPADDRGLTLGVGLFETILFIDGAPLYWRPHVERLLRSCADLGLPAPEPAVLEKAAAEAVAAASLAVGRAAVRLTWTGGPGARGLAAPDEPAPRLHAHAVRSPEPPEAVTLATVAVRRNPSSPTSRLKTLSYLDNVEARREANAKNADEALCLDVEGRVSCAAAGNVFWLEEGSLCTPASSCGVLEGVIRAEVIRAAPEWRTRVAQVEAMPERLMDAQAAFITNSLIGWAAIASIDGVSIARPPAALAARLTALLR